MDELNLEIKTDLKDVKILSLSESASSSQTELIRKQSSSESEDYFENISESTIILWEVY